MEVASARDGVKLKVRSDSGLPTRFLAVVTTIGLLVGATGWVYVAASGPRDDYLAQRQDVITRASDFAVTFNTYEVTDKAEYQRRVKKLMTTKYFTEFKKITDAMFAAIKDRKQSSGDAKVLSAAVQSVDKDSATVIAAVNAAVRVDSKKAPVLRRFRWQIQLTKVRDQWLVRGFDTVPAVQATLGNLPSRKSTAP